MAVSPAKHREKDRPGGGALAALAARSAGPRRAPALALAALLLLALTLKGSPLRRGSRLRYRLTYTVWPGAEREPPGLERARFLADACGQRAERAWVTMASDERTLGQALVAAASLRRLNTTGDVVVLFFGDAPPPACVAPALARLCVRLLAARRPVEPEDVENEQYRRVIDSIDKWWDFAKLLAFDLTDYRRAVFLDGDVLFLRTPDVLLDAPPGAHTDAPKSPFNSGMFVLEPSHADFDALISLVRRGDYDLQRGWGGVWEDPERRYRPRTYAPFYGAETTQGLFHYFFTHVKRAAPALDRRAHHWQEGDDPPRDGEQPVMAHFNICPKPVPGVRPDRCRRLHAKWNAIWASLKLGECRWDAPAAAAG